MLDLQINIMQPKGLNSNFATKEVSVEDAGYLRCSAMLKDGGKEYFWHKNYDIEMPKSEILEDAMPLILNRLVMEVSNA